MRTRTIEKTVYRLEELTERARDNALNTLAGYATCDNFWVESVLEDAKAIGAMLGISIKNIEYSGFSSQGDGACFTGTYSYARGAAKAVRQHAPQDAALHAIADRLQVIERRNFYRLTANIYKSSHYYSHANTVTVETDDSGIAGDSANDGALADTLRDFMRWIYSALQTEFDYITSPEAIGETIDANGYEFDENGGIA